MKEREIRNKEAHKQYLELVQADTWKIFKDRSTFEHINCPACGEIEDRPLFEKKGFQYVQCPICATIYNSPRPQYADIQKLYNDSKSTKFWIENFFMPFIEARREKIFKPRAEYIVSELPTMYGKDIGDVGAGFGIFLEELRKIWSGTKFYAIEPSEDMAQICKIKGFTVIKSMVEDIIQKDITFDLLTSFELIEHLHNPVSFFQKIYNLLKKDGYFCFTTLNGLGFDIQVLWEKSNSIVPPHHLNFFNPSSINILLKRSGFRAIDISTPGRLDWDIVENSIKDELIDIGRFFKTVYMFGTEIAKAKLQGWISEFKFSSHMRVLAKKI